MPAETTFGLLRPYIVGPRCPSMGRDGSMNAMQHVGAQQPHTMLAGTTFGLLRPYIVEIDGAMISIVH